MEILQRTFLFAVRTYIINGYLFCLYRSFAVHQADFYGGISFEKTTPKKLLCILLAIAAVVCVIFACFMLTKHKQADSASSAAASVSQFGSVADFDYEAFDYSDGLDENGYWSGIKALDYVTLPEDFGSIALKENDLTPHRR